MSIEKKPLFQMPVVGIGDVVHWYPDGDTNTIPCAAIVTARQHRGVSLSIVHPDNYNLWVRDGVRHRDDPERNPEETRLEGVWEHTPLRKSLDQVIALVLNVKTPARAG